MNKKKLLASLMLLSMASSNIAPLTVLAQSIDSVPETSQSSEESSSTSETESSETSGDTSSVDGQTQETQTAASQTLDTVADGQEEQNQSQTETSSTEAPANNEQEKKPETDKDETPASSSDSKSESQTPQSSETASSQQKKPEASQPNLPSKSQAISPTAPDKIWTDRFSEPAGFSSSQNPDWSNIELPAGTVAFGSYVDRWSGDDAYTHNLLSHRYGIKAEQLDGFLKSTKINYDSKRINGSKLLEWEQKSGLDVRAIVAIAMAESSLGTAGVATLNGANMFGYGAFDDNPNNAVHYSDDVAIQRLTIESIIRHRNTSFKIQDDKAKLNAAGRLNTLTDGGVYFTDTSGSGQKRAQIMEKLDKWIDEHGGTPEVPEELRNLGTVSTAAVPEGYTISRAVMSSNYIAATYPWGECTWYVYNRARELGYSFGPYMGNGGDWKSAPGYELSQTPKVGYAVSFSPGQAGADGTYGHVAIVEEVKEDGSILISESNALGRGVVSYRTFTAQQAKTLTYVVGRQ